MSLLLVLAACILFVVSALYGFGTITGASLGRTLALAALGLACFAASTKTP